MGDLETLWRVWLVLLIVVLCVLPLVLFGLVLWLSRRYVNSLTDPDVDHLHRQYKRLQAEHPHDDHDELVRAVIRGQAIKCGVVGALTGLGGFVTLPIALPADVLISLRLQASVVQFVAEAYGHTTPSDIELQVRRTLILSGGARISRSTFRLLMSFFARFLQRSLAKFIPLLGALIGFAVDYALANGSGMLAQKWYSGAITLPDVGSVGQLMTGAQK